MQPALAVAEQVVSFCWPPAGVVPTLIGILAALNPPRLPPLLNRIVKIAVYVVTLAPQVPLPQEKLPRLMSLIFKSRERLEVFVVLRRSALAGSDELGIFEIGMAGKPAEPMVEGLKLGRAGEVPLIMLLQVPGSDSASAAVRSMSSAAIFCFTRAVSREALLI